MNGRKFYRKELSPRKWFSGPIFDIDIADLQRPGIDLNFRFLEFPRPFIGKPLITEQIGLP